MNKLHSLLYSVTTCNHTFFLVNTVLDLLIPAPDAQQQEMD